MTQYLVIYSTGKSLIGGEKYFIQTKDKVEYVEAIKEIKRRRYTILHKSHDEKKIKM